MACVNGLLKRGEIEHALPLTTKPLQKEKPRSGVVSFMVERVGLEPTTHGLKVRCSTD